MIDPDSNEARLARMRAACRTVHPDVAAARRTALGNAQEALQTAVGHLQKVLNECRSADEQLRADTAAREWLASIGSEPN